MIHLVSKVAVPYVLTFDREREAVTTFHLVPMTAEEAGRYRARWQALNAEYNVPAALKSRNVVKLDRETLLGVLEKIESVYEQGDVIEGAQVAEVVDALDYVVIQELVIAVQSMSLLEAGRKKS